MEKTLVEQLDCARRELAQRIQVYPQWLVARTITPTQAAHELACMRAIIATLEALLIATSGQRDLFMGEQPRCPKIP